MQRHHSCSCTYCGAGVARVRPLPWNPLLLPLLGFPKFQPNLHHPQSARGWEAEENREDEQRAARERGVAAAGTGAAGDGVAALDRDPRQQPRRGAPRNLLLTRSPVAPWVGASDTWSRRVGGRRQERAQRLESPDPELGELGGHTAPARDPRASRCGGSGGRR